MSNYVKTTDFAAKDALPTGNPAKVASGTQVDTEFNNIATAIATKEDTANKGANNGYAGLNSSGDVERSNLPAETAYTDTQNVFTANQEIQGASPALTIDETDATANERTWIIRAVGGNLHISTATDAAPGTPVTNPIIINRNGTVIDSIQLDATEVTVNSNTVWHEGNDGAGSGLDADFLDGEPAETTATADSIAKRDASGRITAANLIQTSSDDENPVVDQIMVTNGTDNIVRKAALSHLAGYLGLKVAYCCVTSAGALHASTQATGITSVTRNTTGDYTVNYTAAGFTNEPIVFFFPITANRTITLVSGLGSTTSAQVQIGNTLSSGAAVDTQFNFLAVGV